MSSKYKIISPKTWPWHGIKISSIFLIPILLLPLPIVLKDSVATFAYCLIIVALFWVFEILNIYVTSFLPMILLPLTGLAKPSNLAKEFMPDVCMLFIGTLFLSAAIQKTGVHKRIALLTLKLFGGNLRSLMFGLMLVTWFLSMWISNTATASLMLPVVEAIFLVIQESNPEEKIPDAITKGLTLSLAAAAVTGGSTTLTGTPGNLACAEIMESMFPGYEPKINFASWLLFGFPSSFLVFLISYLFMNFYWFGWFRNSGQSNTDNMTGNGSDSKLGNFKNETIKIAIDKQYNELPNMKFNEYYTIFSLISMVIFWFFSSPGFITGWAELYPSENRPSDSTVALIFGLLFFIVPDEIKNFKKPILNWPYAQKNIPWGTIILIGSGVALSRASRDSGFSDWMAEILSKLEFLPKEVIILIIVIFTTFFTEITSNTGASNLLIPVVNSLAVSLKVNPLYLTMPVAFACSFAYMLPIASGANALAFSYGRIRIIDMVKNGILLNFVGIGVTTLSGIYYGPVIFDSRNDNQTWILG